MLVHRLLLVTTACLLLQPNVVLAEWFHNGTPVITSYAVESSPVACSDGAGGAIMVWESFENGGDIHAQRINASGVLLWSLNGVVICNEVDAQYLPAITSDGAGGAIVTWLDERNDGTNGADIYAQRINSLGAVQWTANGAPVCQVNEDQIVPLIVSDGANGAIIVWRDMRPVSQQDIYAQRLNGAGAAQWTLNGVGVCIQPGQQELPAIAADGAGGVFVTWQDFRNGHYDVFANRITSAGSALWGVSGAPVCTVSGWQNNPKVAPDGMGGAIVTWSDFRGANQDIYAQRMNPMGFQSWSPADGVPVCQASDHQSNPVIIADGAGGGFIAWQDHRVSTNPNIFAQRVTASGSSQWTLNGIGVCQAAGAQHDPILLADGAGGVFVTWIDIRSGAHDIYTQRIDTVGASRWQVDGMPVTTAPDVQAGTAVTTNGAGGMLIAFHDTRAGYADIYAQRIEGRYGYWGRPEPVLNFVKDVPSDQGGKVRLEWTASGRDVLNQQFISHYSIWRAIDQAAFNGALQAGVPNVTVSDIGRDFTGTAIRKSGDAQTTEYFWQLVGTQQADYHYAYSFDAATSFDSTAANAATHYFQVVSYALESQYINWPSNTLSGRSVDNLAPPAPLFLSALRVGADVHLQWNRVRVRDLDNYRVYRATSTGVTPIPPNFLTNDDDTLMVDSSAPTSALYYIVTAKDVHGNEGVASNEAGVNALTGAGNLPLITTLTVLQNHPNPFTGETQLEVGLPAKSDVRVEVFDVAGRRMRATRIPNQTKGWNTVRLDSRDDAGASLPSGVYFYRVHAGGATVTRKMVITR